MKTKDKIVPLSEKIQTIYVYDNDLGIYYELKNERTIPKGSEVFKIKDIAEALKNVEEEIGNLNETFRKDNIPQRLSGDKLNDLWDEKTKEILKKHFGQFGDEK